MTDEDLGLARDLVAFAVRPSEQTAARLPFAEQVRLGLGRDLRTTLDEGTMAEASAWVLEAPAFRAATGPFDVLGPLRRHAGTTGSTSVQARGGAFDVSVGEHPHCAGPPVPAPRGFEHRRRVSVQPSESSVDGCLSWFALDLFVDDEGSIRAVTLDVWEP